jgi:hypothetical protein
MPQIVNPHTILDGYFIDFPTISIVNSTFGLGITLQDQNLLGFPKFLYKPKLGTSFSNNKDLIGYDVPVLIHTKYDICKGIVAILGQDALRDPKDPLLNGINTTNDIVVGLPYAIAFDRNYKQVAVYHNLIKDILDAGYDVYLTDIWKSWDAYHNSRLGRWTNGNSHKQCLDAEFNGTCINISYIVLMGVIAQNKFKTILNTTNIIDIRVPHLSPSANGIWKNKLGGKPINEPNKIDYVKNEMRKNGIQV